LLKEPPNRNVPPAPTSIAPAPSLPSAKPPAAVKVPSVTTIVPLEPDCWPIWV